MKKTMLFAAVVFGISSCNLKKNTESAAKWPTRIDTIVYSSPKDPQKMDTLLVKVGIDTTFVGSIDTVLVPSPNPPYNPIVTIRKAEIPRTGQKIEITTTKRFCR